MEVQNMLGRGEDTEEGEGKLDLLSFLLKKTSWSPSQVVDNAVDLLGAGIDTVGYAFCMLWVLEHDYLHTSVFICGNLHIY